MLEGVLRSFSSKDVSKPWGAYAFFYSRYQSWQDRQLYVSVRKSCYKVWTLGRLFASKLCSNLQQLSQRSLDLLFIHYSSLVELQTLAYLTSKYTPFQQLCSFCSSALEPSCSLLATTSILRVRNALAWRQLSSPFSKAPSTIRALKARCPYTLTSFGGHGTAAKASLSVYFSSFDAAFWTRVRWTLSVFAACQSCMILWSTCAELVSFSPRLPTLADAASCSTVSRQLRTSCVTISSGLALKQRLSSLWAPLLASLRYLWRFLHQARLPCALLFWQRSSFLREYASFCLLLAA